MSYRTDVKTKQAAQWLKNGLRFVDEESARQYGISLMRRWPDMTDFDVQPSDEHVNCQFPVPSDRYPVAGRKWSTGETEGSRG